MVGGGGIDESQTTATGPEVKRERSNKGCVYRVKCFVLREGCDVFTATVGVQG